MYTPEPIQAFNRITSTSITEELTLHKFCKFCIIDKWQTQLQSNTVIAPSFVS